MKRWMIASLLLLSTAGLAGSAQPEKKQSNAPAFDTFRLVVDRNIFDKNRRPHQEQAKAAPASAPARKVDHVDLLGTMVADAHPIAFINGGKYSPVTPGEDLFNWKIDAITTEAMVLSFKGEKITWPVGSALERVNEGKWEVVQSRAREASLDDLTLEDLAPSRSTNHDSSRSSRDSSHDSSHSSRGSSHSDNTRSSDSRNGRDGGRSSQSDARASAAPSPAGDSTGSEDDVLKRMMERRQKEGGR